MIKCPRSHPTADIVVRDQWVYIPETSGLRALNIANPKNIYENAHRAFPNGANRLTLNNDNYLYVADGASGLVFYNLNDPWNPQPEANGYLSPTPAYALAAQDSYIYLIEEDRPQVLDVTSKSHVIDQGCVYTGAVSALIPQLLLPKMGRRGEKNRKIESAWAVTPMHFQFSDFNDKLCIINHMNAILIHQPNSLSLVDLPVPQPGDGEVLIKVMASGICGTDIHIFHGEFLGSYPIIPGHEFAGVVEQVGDRITRYKVGDRVAVEPNIACNNCVNCLNNRQNFCLNWSAIGVTRPGGMAQYVLAPENAVFSIGDLPFEQGAFVEPLSCVLHGSQRARLRMGDRVLILGAGPIGLLLLQVVLLQGATSITAVERQPARAMMASQFGAEQVYTELDMLQPASYDVVIDATGVIPLMNRTIDFARPGGTVLLFGVPPSGKLLEMEAFKIFKNGLTVLSSFTSVRNSYQAVALLSSGQVDVARLVSHRLPLAEFQHGMQLIEQGRENVMKVMMVPNK